MKKTRRLKQLARGEGVTASTELFFVTNLCMTDFQGAETLLKLVQK